jgi:hypothetical protein
LARAKDSRRPGELSLKRGLSWPLFFCKILEEAMFSKNSRSVPDPEQLRLKKLTGQQVEQIDELLSSLEEHGEIHLIVQRGTLKYINKVEKYKSWGTDDQGLAE